MSIVGILDIQIELTWRRRLQELVWNVEKANWYTVEKRRKSRSTERGQGAAAQQEGRDSEPSGMAIVQSPSVHLIDAHHLAEDLHSDSRYFLLDCRPVLAYNSCHISGAVNINFTGMMKKRFIAGKIGLQDLVTTEEGKEKFKVCLQVPTLCCATAWAGVRWWVLIREQTPNPTSFP